VRLIDENGVATLQLGSGETVVLDKLFGPTIFADLRITVDTSRGWVISRKWVKTDTWIEWCVIPAQIDEEFDDFEHPSPSQSSTAPETESDA
jgi:hypothetical protein